MNGNDVEARLHAALDELTRTAALRHADGPRADAQPSGAHDVGRGVPPDAVTGEGRSPDSRHPGWVDPKLLVMAACVVLVLAALGAAGLNRALRHRPSNTVSTSTSLPTPASTLPAIPTTTGPRVPATSVPTTTTVPAGGVPGTGLPISVQSDSQMVAAGNTGPTSSVLIPSSCALSGQTVTATGSYAGGFAPNVYNRFGDVVELYVFGAPSAGYPQGAQLAVSPVASSPAVGSGTWQVSAGVDRSIGQPARCVVAAQPTHDPQFAP